MKYPAPRSLVAYLGCIREVSRKVASATRMLRRPRFSDGVPIRNIQVYEIEPGTIHQGRKVHGHVWFYTELDPRDSSHMHTHFVYGGFMIQTSEARELCSKSEWELVESSFFPMVETLPRSGLKSRLERARKLYGKTTDLVSRLDHSNIVHQAHERRRQTHVTIPVGGMGLRRDRIVRRSHRTLSIFDKGDHFSRPPNGGQVCYWLCMNVKTACVRLRNPSNFRTAISQIELRRSEPIWATT